MCGKMICLISFVLVLGMVITNGANAADPNLVGWWKFDEGSGTTASDSSGNGYDGALEGDLGWVPGYYSGALDFKAAGAVIIPPESCSSIEKQVTITCWVYGDPDLQPHNDCLFAASGGGGRVVNCHLPYSDGNVYWDVHDAGGGRDRIFKAATPEEYEGAWQHWAFTKDADAGEQKIYLNGVLWHSGSGLTRTMTGVTEFLIGCRPGDIAYAYAGLIDDFRLYDRALTEAEIQQAMIVPPPGLASDPSPGDGATDVPRDVILIWTPGIYADKHDVYFGTNFDDVNDATNLDPMGLDKLYRAHQDVDSYAVPETLDFGQTYYWRVDEVNAPPDSTIFRGNVCQFTAEPVAYTIAGEKIFAAASSSNNTDEGPENTINGSGLDASDLHSAESTDMWLSSAADPNATWIQYEFDKVYKLHQMLVWNYNTSIESTVGFGIKDATIEYLTDGNDYTILNTTHEFAQAPGSAGYAVNTFVDFGGVVAKYVKITVNSNWGGILSQYGMSEIRFFYIPVLAREPNPASGTTDMDVDNVTLSWRAGREAASHDVYLSTDEQAVIDGTVPVTAVTEPSYASSLDLASTYYWRVDEVNDAETPTTWQGDIWSLSTQEYLVVDDFESYNDISAGEEGSNLVYLTWIDGFDNPFVNGSTMGYAAAFQPSMEKSVVHDGKQSVPFFYDNSTAAYSEATVNIADLPIGSDWTGNGVKTLSLWFSGDVNNVPEQMYVKLNGVKVLYDSDTSNLRKALWQPWNINLADFGLDLSNVTDLSIGLERSGSPGGLGIVLFDDIRLYPFERQLIMPTEPSTENLVANYAFEGNLKDSSGNNLHGTAIGDPTYVAGKIGQGINLDGDDCADFGNRSLLDFGTGDWSVSAWIKMAAVNEAAYLDDNPFNTVSVIFAKGGDGDGGIRYSLSVGEGNDHKITLTTDDNASKVEAKGGTVVDDDNWHQIIALREGSKIRVYVDGSEDASNDLPDGYDLSGTSQANAYVGAVWIIHWTDIFDNELIKFFTGMIDDVRIYDRALTKAEIAWLAGVTKPFDKPF